MICRREDRSQKATPTNTNTQREREREEKEKEKRKIRLIKTYENEDQDALTHHHQADPNTFFTSHISCKPKSKGDGQGEEDVSKKKGTRGLRFRWRG